MNDQLLATAYRFNAELTRERAATATAEIVRRWLLEMAMEFDGMAAELERKLDVGRLN